MVIDLIPEGSPHVAGGGASFCDTTGKTRALSGPRMGSQRVLPTAWRPGRGPMGFSQETLRYWKSEFIIPHPAGVLASWLCHRPTAASITT